MKIKIFITGGHVTPAIATIDAIKKDHPDWSIIFVGRKVSMEGERTLSEEYRLITAKHISFLSLIAGRFKREGGFAALIALAKTPIGFIQSLWYVLTERPDCIVSFGGYVALPVVLSGWLFRIPIVTHEQTRKPGLANRIIARFATRTCISFADGGNGLRGVLIHTGLPLRESVFHPSSSSTIEVPKDKRPIVLIVGGSTGAMSVNAHMYNALPTLLETYTIIHQVGRNSIGYANEVKKNLKKNQNYYVPVPYLSEIEYSWALHNALFIIGRSGANTVMEIAATGKIALFIPLPWSAENEQYFNALYLKEAGTSEILLQKDMTAGTILEAIQNLKNSRVHREKNALRLARQIPRDGASRLAKVIYGVTTS